eukprot:scaffold9501_cov75-Phaeocystis_antarctica.AAC.3
MCAACASLEARLAIAHAPSSCISRSSSAEAYATRACTPPSAPRPCARSGSVAIQTRIQPADLRSSYRSVMRRASASAASCSAGVAEGAAKEARARRQLPTCTSLPIPVRPVLDPTQSPVQNECSSGSPPRGGKWTDRSSGSVTFDGESGSSLPLLESLHLAPAPAPAAAGATAAAAAASWFAAGSAGSAGSNCGCGSAPLADRSEAMEGASPVSKGTSLATPSASTKARRTSGESVWLERAPRAAAVALSGSPALASSIVTSADTPPASSIAASRGCEAMLPRARAACSRSSAGESTPHARTSAPTTPTLSSSSQSASITAMPLSARAALAATSCGAPSSSTSTVSEGAPAPIITRVSVRVRGSAP